VIKIALLQEAAILLQKSDLVQSLGFMMNLSSYAEDLTEEAKKRYKKKLTSIGGVDPFVSVVGELCERMPPMESIDIVHTWFCRPVL